MNEDFMELDEKIRNSVGWIALDKYDLLKQSIHTFEMNFKELEKYLLILQNEKFASTLWQEKHSKQLNNYHQDLVRLLHNFNASVMSLVDHTRVYMNENYNGTSFYNEYQKLIRQYFVDDGLVQFVQNLRNLIMHKGMPPTFLQLNYRDGVGKSYMLMNHEKLKEFKRWNSKSKAYLKMIDRDIDVLELVKGYHSKCVEFNNRFRNALETYHKEDLEHMWVLQDQVAVIAKERFGWKPS